MAVGIKLNQVHQGDCLEILGKIRPQCIDLVFADPPFNIGYDYDAYDDAREEQDYLNWSEKWMRGVYRILKSNGTFWLAIGDEYAAELKVLAKQIGFYPRSWVIWYYTFGVNCHKGYSRSHTHLLHFVKDPDNFTFNYQNPAIRIPSARQLVYGDARANPKGRLPDNTWILRPQDIPQAFPAEHDTWYFARVAGTFKEREGFHGCQMPEQLLGRIIRSSSNPQDIVLDPFSGSGTTLAVAHKLGRRWLGSELSQQYVQRIAHRLLDTKPGDPLDGPENPLQSAPATRDGRTIPGFGKTRNRAENANQDERLVQAFRRTHQGHSADYMIADPHINKAFLQECKNQQIPGHPVQWNSRLLSLRKAKKLAVETTERFRRSFRQMDPYSFAAEIALAQLALETDCSVDEILCHPDLAKLFDRIAGDFAPGFEILDYRWAALSFRKRAAKYRQTAEDSAEWWIRQLPAAQPLAAITGEPGESGVYVLLGDDDLPLFVGETYDLAARLEQIRETQAWQELDLRSAIVIRQLEPNMLGLKSVLVHRTRPPLNSSLVLPPDSLRQMASTAFTPQGSFAD